MSRLQELIKKISKNQGEKIIFLVIDGLGGLPDYETGKTELETAYTPFLDNLAKESECGCIIPIERGITPGSGPAHLSLFGYDPLDTEIKRGVLSAMGVNFSMEPGDVACRINFATIDPGGIITDRRAGRIPTEENKKLCEKLEKIELPDVKIFARPEKEHRAVLIFRGNNLSDELEDTDPQKTGLPSRTPEPLSPDALKMSAIVSDFIYKAKRILEPHYPANMILARGFSRAVQIPTMKEIFKLECGAIAVYPMYKGLARLVGMEVLEAGETLESEVAVLEKNLSRFDYIFFHYKNADSRGEDGNFLAKVKALEEFDNLMPRILALEPGVLIVTGDHSTPANMKSHSWHPVPVMIRSSRARKGTVQKFNESECSKGTLGIFYAKDLMTLAMAHADRLEKFGA